MKLTIQSDTNGDDGVQIQEVAGGISIRRVSEAKPAAIDPTEVTRPSDASQIKSRLAGFNRGSVANGAKLTQSAFQF